MRRWSDGTNVGDVDLPAATAGTAHTTAHGSAEAGPTAVSAGTARSHSAAHSTAATEAAAGDSSSGRAEAWLSLAVLSGISNSQLVSLGGGLPLGRRQVCPSSSGC